MNRQKQVYPIIVLLLAIAGIVITVRFGIQGKFDKVALSGFLFLFLFTPIVMERVLRVQLDDLMCSFIAVFSFAAYELGTVLEWYGQYEYYDVIVHCVSGVLFTLMGFYQYFLLQKNTDFKKDWILAGTYALFFSLFIALMWEVGEFFGFLITGQDLQHSLTTGATDTMEDFLICIVGSVLMIVDYLFYVRKNRGLFFQRSALHFIALNRK